MSALPTTPTTSVTIPERKYNYVTLLQSVLDMSSDETKGDLAYISDHSRNCDELDYVCITTSLAVALNTAVQQKQEEIILPEPGMPLYEINGHLTSNLWYEVVYRSLRVLDVIYKTNKIQFFEYKTAILSYPHSNINPENKEDMTLVRLNIILGCHRVIRHFVSETALHTLIKEDLGYTLDDMQYDILRIQLIYSFTRGIYLFAKNQHMYQAACWFMLALDVSKQVKLSKTDKLISDFENLCYRCVYVCLGYHHFQSSTAHLKYPLIEKYFILAVNLYGYQDPQNMVEKINKMIKASSLPQKQSLATEEECEKEINNLIRDPEHDLTGLNLFDICSFTLIA